MTILLNSRYLNGFFTASLTLITNQKVLTFNKKLKKLLEENAWIINKKLNI